MITCDLKNTNWKRIKNGLNSYFLIMNLVKTSNVRTNKELRRLFNGFYRIRQRPKEFYDSLYDYLERNKNKKTSFKQTLAFFHQRFQRFEPSFSSKIVATINPNLPIWDSEVLARLALKEPGRHLDQKTRFARILKTYDEIVVWYDEFLNTNQAKKMLKIFDEKIGNSNITDIKKIDLILWQTRS